MNVKYLLLVIFNLLTTDFFVYWEDLSEADQNKVVQGITNKDVCNLFKDNFKVGDNNQTKILLDTLSNLPLDTSFKALYFSLFNQICKKADGSVSEILGNPCQNILLSNPEYVMFYLKKNPRLAVASFAMPNTLRPTGEVVN